MSEFERDQLLEKLANRILRRAGWLHIKDKMDLYQINEILGGGEDVEDLNAVIQLLTNRFVESTSDQNARLIITPGAVSDFVEKHWCTWSRVMGERLVANLRAQEARAIVAPEEGREVPS